MKNARIFFILVIALVTHIIGISQTKFNKRFNHGGNEWSQNLLLDVRGQLVTVGFSTPGTASRGHIISFIDTNGNLLDTNRLSLGDKRFATTTINVLHEEITDSTYIVAGNRQWLDPWVWQGFRSQASLVKYNQNGDTVWTSAWGNNTQNIWINSMCISKFDAYYLVGYNNDSTLQKKGLYISKTNKQGNLLWEKTIVDTPTNEFAFSIFENNEGNIILGGCKDLVAGSNITTPRAYMLDSNGNVLYIKTWSDTTYFGSAFIFDRKLPSTRLDRYLGANNIPNNPPGYYGWAGNIIELKGLDTNFNTIWKRIISTDEYSDFWHILPLKNNNILIAGTVEHPITDLQRGWALLLDDKGSTIWDRRYTNCTEGSHYLSDAIEMPDGGFVMCGTTSGNCFPDSTQDAWIIRVDSNGCIDNTISACWPTTLEDISKAKNTFEIFPNPNNGLFTIRNTKELFAQNIMLDVFDITGKVVYNTTLKSGLESQSIHLPNSLQYGIYVIQLTQEGNKVFTSKLIIQP
jgi:hypothetical protein